jgi:hypothetical protein
MANMNDTDPRGLDIVLQTLYDSISGPAGATRDWARNDDLYAPGARLMIAHRGADGVVELETLTVEQFRASRDPLFRSTDFFEVEVGREVAVHGAVAHVMSAYEARRTADGPAFASGHNSLQLVFSAGRWWVLSCLWEGHATSAQLRSGSFVRLTG